MSLSVTEAYPPSAFAAATKRWDVVAYKHWAGCSICVCLLHLFMHMGYWTHFFKIFKQLRCFSSLNLRVLLSLLLLFLFVGIAARVRRQPWLKARPFSFLYSLSVESAVKEHLA